MAYLVLALGAFLSIGGALSILSGYNIVEVERGWTAVIAGATALTGGIVTIALGLAIKVLMDMRSALQDQATVVLPADGHETLDPTPGHDLLVPPAPAEPPAMLMTPELENSMLAAILSAHDNLSTHDNAPQDSAVVGRELVDRNDMRAPSIEDLLETQKRNEAISSPQLGTEAVINSGFDNGEPTHGGITSKTPVLAPVADTSRFKVTFKRPSSQAPLPQAPTPVLQEGTGHDDAEGPAMDDWLDRAFSALDSEGTQKAGLHRPASNGPDSPSPEPERDGKAYADVQTTRTIDDVAPIEHELAYAEAAPGLAEGNATPQHEAELPIEGLTPSAPAATSAVIGRYEADGTSYIMYADGSIEAHSEAGVYRFTSMAELKSFIESTE